MEPNFQGFCIAAKEVEAEMQLEVEAEAEAGVEFGSATPLEVVEEASTMRLQNAC